MVQKRKKIVSTRNIRKNKASGHFTLHTTTRRFEDELLVSLYNSTKKQLPHKKAMALLRTCGDEAPGATLKQLLDEGILIKNAKEIYELAKKHPLCEGRFSANSRGFGFVSITKQSKLYPDFEKDIFVAAASTGNATHGDRVLLRVFQQGRQGRLAGRIIAILEEADNLIGGLVTECGKQVVVSPDDTNLNFVVTLPNDPSLQLQLGQIVFVRYQRDHSTPKMSGSAMVSGELVQIVGPQESVDSQLALIRKKHDLPQSFSAEAMAEAETLALSADSSFTQSTKTDKLPRRDLRHLAHVTIDGEDAKDFDDAIFIERDNGTEPGFTLYVSIADVSHYVREGSNLDTEAYRRGTSVYFPGRVIPMLPEQLSNNLCSLRPDEDRFCVTTILNFSADGHLQKKQFCRSIIRSQYRFTYTLANQLLEDTCTEKGFIPLHLRELLQTGGELASRIRGHRIARGSLEFDLPEANISLHEDGSVSTISGRDHNRAHMLIEEFMLAANEAVAQHFKEQQLPLLYRIHESPDPKKGYELSRFVTSLGFTQSPFENNSSWYRDIVSQARTSKHEQLINSLVLRHMQQARYSPENPGHFGLAAKYYAHFTSPIRRYPDLIVHRLLLASLGGKESEYSTEEALERAGEHLSQRERVAVNAERDMAERMKFFYMRDRVGEQFSAFLSGFSANNLFVEIKEISVTGAVPLSSLPHDYYYLDEAYHRLVGELSGKFFRLGDPLTVTLTEAGPQNRHLYFRIN